MAGFIQIEQSNVGVERMIRKTAGAQAAGNLVANIIVGALAVVGQPVTRAVAKIGSVLEAQAAAHKQRREDERLWSVALQDARVMADLSRAMSQSAERNFS